VGIEFFQRALKHQKKYSEGKEIANSLQTNGTLLDDDWCEFLAKNQFLVGLSLDGPEPVHDAYPVDREGKGTSDTMFKSLRRMQRHGVQVNVLVAVNNRNSTQPLEVYRFLRQHGVQFIQFIPIVEREADPEAKALGIPLALPPSLNRAVHSTTVTSWSVEPKQYGEFLIRIFDEWIRNDQRVSASCGAWNETDVGVHSQRDPHAEDHGNDLIHTQLSSTLAAPSSAPPSPHNNSARPPRHPRRRQPRLPTVDRRPLLEYAIICKCQSETPPSHRHRGPASGTGR